MCHALNSVKCSSSTNICVFFNSDAANFSAIRSTLSLLLEVFELAHEIFHTFCAVFELAFNIGKLLLVLVFHFLRNAFKLLFILAGLFVQLVLHTLQFLAEVAYTILIIFFVARLKLISVTSRSSLLARVSGSTSRRKVTIVVRFDAIVARRFSVIFLVLFRYFPVLVDACANESQREHKLH